LQAVLPRHPNAFSRMVTRSRGRPRPAGNRTARERASKVTRLLGEALTWLTLMHASAMIATRLHARHIASAAWVVLGAAPPPPPSHARLQLLCGTLRTAAAPGPAGSRISAVSRRAALTSRPGSRAAKQGGTARRPGSTSSGAPWTCRTSRSSAGPGPAWACACLRAQQQSCTSGRLLAHVCVGLGMPHASLWQLRRCQPTFGFMCHAGAGSRLHSDELPRNHESVKHYYRPWPGRDLHKVVTAGQGSMRHIRRLIGADA